MANSIRVGHQRQAAIHLLVLLLPLLALPFGISNGWLPLAPQPNRAVWTDNFSSLLTVFRWR